MSQYSNESAHVVQLIHKLKTAIDASSDILNNQEARTNLSYLSRELTIALEPPDVTVSLVAWCVSMTRTISRLTSDQACVGRL